MRAFPLPLVFHCVIDARSIVVESTAARLAVGTQIMAASWLGEEIVQAVRAAIETGYPFRTVARDDQSGTHWILEAVPDAASENDLRFLTAGSARVTFVDATLAVQGQRDAALSKVVHAMRNISFAMMSVIASIEADAPTGADLALYLAHLGGPAERLSVTMTLMADLLAPVVLVRRQVHAQEVVDQAIALVEPARRPGTVSVSPGLSMTVDPPSMARTIASMLESRLRVPAQSLAVDRMLDETAYVLISVVRPMAAEERTAVHTSWDLAGGLELDAALRLARGRAVVVAHGGSVLSETTEAGLVRMAIRVPEEGPLL